MLCPSTAVLAVSAPSVGSGCGAVQLAVQVDRCTGYSSPVVQHVFSFHVPRYEILLKGTKYKIPGLPCAGSAMIYKAVVRPGERAKRSPVLHTISSLSAPLGRCRKEKHWEACTQAHTAHALHPGGHVIGTTDSSAYTQRVSGPRSLMSRENSCGNGNPCSATCPYLPHVFIASHATKMLLSLPKEQANLGERARRDGRC